MILCASSVLGVAPADAVTANPDVVAQGAFSIRLSAEGTLTATGTNVAGQLGDGTTDNRLQYAPMPMPAGVTVRSVTAGQSHSVVIGNDFKLYGTGANTFGQLASTGASPTSLTLMGALPNSLLPMQAAAGYDHTIVLGNDNKPYAVGDNSSGALADGSVTQRTSFVAMTGLPAGVTALSAAGGNRFSVIRASDGKAYASGDNTQGELGVSGSSRASLVAMAGLPAGVTAAQVAAGADHTVVRGSDGKVYATGRNIEGQLGDTTATQRNGLVVVGGLPAGVTAQRVAAGAAHTVVLGSDNKVYATGDNSQGQLGDTTNVGRRALVAMGSIPAGRQPVAIAAGARHTSVLLDNGEILATGSNFGGELGDNTTTGEQSLVQALRTTNRPPQAPTIGAISNVTENETFRLIVSVGTVATDPDGDSMRFVDSASDNGIGRLVCGAAASAGALRCNFSPWTFVNGVSDMPLRVTDGIATTTTFLRVRIGANPCRTTSEACAVQWASSGDVPAPADFNGDSHTDLAIYRPSTGTWFVRGIFDDGVRFGSPGDVPCPGKYFRAAASMCVFRAGTWFISDANDGVANHTIRFGAPGDLPCPSTWAGTGVTTLCVYRPSTGTWFIDRDNNGIEDTRLSYGAPGDLPAPGIWSTSEETVRAAVFRPSTGKWFVRGLFDDGRSFASPGDVPAQGQFFGGALDVAVFRPSNGTWFVRTARFV